MQKSEKPEKPEEKSRSILTLGDMFKADGLGPLSGIWNKKTPSDPLAKLGGHLAKAEFRRIRRAVIFSCLPGCLGCLALALLAGAVLALLNSDPLIAQFFGLDLMSSL